MWSVTTAEVSGMLYENLGLGCCPELQLSSLMRQDRRDFIVFGSERWTRPTLNCGKTRPCFPAESTHYQTV